MNGLHPVMQAALAPWSPPPAVESMNDDDTYVVDLVDNRVVRQCSSDLLRAGGSIPVGLGQAVLTGIQARHRIAYEAERQATLGKPSEVDELRAERDEMLKALLAEQEWQQRQEAGALDPEWDYELMVANKRRTAIARQIVREAVRQAFSELVA
jgi:hypothetical protein